MTKITYLDQSGALSMQQGHFTYQRELLFEILFLLKKKTTKMRDLILDCNTALPSKFKCLIVSLRQEDSSGKDSLDTETIVGAVGPREFHESENAL